MEATQQRLLLRTRGRSTCGGESGRRSGVGQEVGVGDHRFWFVGERLLLAVLSLLLPAFPSAPTRA